MRFPDSEPGSRCFNAPRYWSLGALNAGAGHLTRKGRCPFAVTEMIEMVRPMRTSCFIGVGRSYYGDRDGVLYHPHKREARDGAAQPATHGKSCLVVARRAV